MIKKDTNNQQPHKYQHHHQAHSDSSAQKTSFPFSFGKTFNSVLKNSRKIIFRVCEVANVKKQIKMFQMYSTIQRRHNMSNDDQKESETTGHDRFYQERSRYKHAKFLFSSFSLHCNHVCWLMFNNNHQRILYLTPKSEIYSTTNFPCYFSINKENLFYINIFSYHIVHLFWYRKCVSTNIITFPHDDLSSENWNHLNRSSYRKKRRKHVRRTQSQNEFETRTLTAANKRHLFR